VFKNQFVQWPIAQLTGGDEFVASGGTERPFLISQLFPQHLHLRTQFVDDFLEILNAP
jgi:hypothetical protein